MKTYEGEITRIGTGNYDGKQTNVSVFEIGNYTIKDLIITDYMDNFVKVGERAKILVAKGLSQGIITKKSIMGIEVNNKRYKEPSGKIIFLNMGKIILYFMLSFVLMFFFSKLAILLGLAALVYYIKEIIDFINF